MNSLNPAGTDGFAFLEFTTPTPALLKKQFFDLGFTESAQHINKPISVFQQNEIYFLLNQNTAGRASDFAKHHGASAMGMGFYVKDSEFALSHALKNGAEDASDNDYQLPAISGVGGSVIYFVDQKEQKNRLLSNQFKFHSSESINGLGLTIIDHVTHNLFRGRMDEMAAFYESIFNFQEIRYFDIKGKQTGLKSRALTSPCGKIRIPLNESSDDKSQIEEFLHEFHGEGIQHIALSTDNIYDSVALLQKNKIEFLNTPDTYYELIEKRLPHHGEETQKLKKLRILIDGDTSGTEKKLLLQIFTQNMLGPVFFEIIQRKGDEGFGEGNFKALFESIELDQIRRGVI